MNFAKYRVQLSTEKKYSSKYEYKYEYEYSIPGAYTNIPSCRRDESMTSFSLQEGIFVYS